VELVVGGVVEHMQQVVVVVELVQQVVESMEIEVEVAKLDSEIHVY